MNCPRCGHDNRPGARFCEQCATPMAGRCASCGAEVSQSAKFCPECAHPTTSSPAAAPPSRFGAPDSYTPKHLAARIAASRAALEGERKQVTVLFADVKGSMELLADRDPEEARTILDPMLQLMMEAVHHYEGTVNQVLGDGIMALFGAPLGHEDHAVRACYAALRMQHASRRYGVEMRRLHGVEVQMRVGLNSGEVVVRSIASDLRMDYTAVGQTTHLAARMEQLATPGTIRLTAETLALAEGYVDVTPLGPTPVKGLMAPVEVYELAGARSARTRLQVTRAYGLTRFVGRAPEMESLGRAAEETRRGRGQIVAVVGEAGVGKSRLYHEFLHSHHAHGWLVLESGAVSYGKATAYLPLVDLLCAYFRLESREDARAVRARVTGNVLALEEALQDAVPPILWLLDALTEQSPFLALEPVERRRRTLAAAKRILLRESQVQPVLLVFEDLHWIDSETQAFLDSLVESLPAASILLAVNYRPEYEHHWGRKSYYRQLSIDPLPAGSAESLLDDLLGPDLSVAPLKPLLIQRTQGNPLFLEECVRTLIESGALAGQRGAHRLVGEPGTVKVPATVQAILAARIDRLSADDKRLLQTASVVGKDVPLVLLELVADLDDSGLRDGLARLQAAEFVYEARLFPDVELTFKHALTHEVAYASLLQDRRQTLHRQLVHAIERRYPERLGEHVERLAHHALRGQMSEVAVKYLRQAGERATARSANREAATLFEQALGVLDELPETPETLGATIDMRIALGSALIPIKGPGAAEVEMSYLRARQLVERLGEATRLYPTLWGLWFSNYARGSYSTARELADQLLEVAASRDDGDQLLEAHHALWATLFAMGDPATALPHLEQGLSLYDPVRHGSPPFLYGGHDPGTCGHYHVARIQWLLGYPDRAAVALRRAVDLADALAHPLSTVFTLTTAAFIKDQLGDRESARRDAERAAAVAKGHEFAAWTDDSGVLLACLAARGSGDGQRAGEVSSRLGTTPGPFAFRQVLNLLLLAATFAEIGDVDKGLAALSAIPEEHRGIVYAPEIQRIHGELLKRRGDRIQAEKCFRDAIDIARRRAERSLELRAAMSLARLLREADQHHEARQVLAPVYAWFTEGFDTADLRAAKTLLDDTA